MRASMTQPLHRMLQSDPEGLAAVDAYERLNWREFVDRVAAIAGALRTLGITPGDRIAMLSRNSADYFAYVFGTWWAGGVINPVNLRWTAMEIGYSLEDCQTRVLIVEDEYAHLIPAIRAQAPGLIHVYTVGEGRSDVADWRALVDESERVEDAARAGDDLAAVLYTGGTTGKPKGVMLSHGNLAGSMFGALSAERARPYNRYLHIAPLYHIGALSGLLIALFADATHYFLPVFEPARLLEMIDREQIAELFLVPTMLRMVVDHPRFGQHDVSSVRRIRYGAAPMDAALMDRALSAFPGAGFHQAYGMTELSPIATILGEEDHEPEARANGRLRTAGRASATAEVRIVDSEDCEVPRGTVGEIVARGPGVMLGYWNQPDATAQALRGGWMHTGDLGRMDEKGYVTVVDRLKDMIVTGGENVYSCEVENALSTHPAVAAVAVIAAPDAKWGERVHAVVVPRPGMEPTGEELAAHCRLTIAAFKLPRSFTFADALPLSAAGKILKNILRDQIMGEGATSDPSCQ